MKPFKVGDNVRTRDGREARIFMVDGGGDQPIIGAVRDAGMSYWHTERWCKWGGWRLGWRLIGESPHDLIHIPETRTVELDVVMWPTGSFSAFLDWGSMKAAYSKPQAVTRITVTFTDGEGL